MDEEDLIQQMLERLRFAGAVDEPGYLGGARTTYNPFAGLGSVTQGQSQYASQAQAIMDEMAAVRNASLGGSQMYVGGSSPTEQALTLNPADQGYVYGPSDAAARTRFTSGVAHDPTARTITDPVEQELALMERRRADPRQGPIPTPLSQAKTVPAN